MKKILSFIMAAIIISSLTVSVIGVDEQEEEIVLYENPSSSEPDPVEEPSEEPLEESGEEVIEDDASEDQTEDPSDQTEEEDDEELESIYTDTLEVNADTVMLMSNLPEDNDYPSGAPLQGGVYIHADTSQLGEIIIYVPTEDQYKAFTYNTSGQPINITGSTITGYTYTGNDYYVRWNSFGQAQYRLVNNSGYGTSYEDLDISEVLNTNVVFIEGNEDLNPLPDATVLSILIFSLVGGCFFCLLLKRL